MNIKEYCIDKNISFCEDVNTNTIHIGAKYDDNGQIILDNSKVPMVHKSIELNQPIVFHDNVFLTGFEFLNNITFKGEVILNGFSDEYNNLILGENIILPDYRGLVIGGYDEVIFNSQLPEVHKIDIKFRNVNKFISKSFNKFRNVLTDGKHCQMINCDAENYRTEVTNAWNIQPEFRDRYVLTDRILYRKPPIEGVKFPYGCFNITFNKDGFFDNENNLHTTQEGLMGGYPLEHLVDLFYTYDSFRRLFFNIKPD
jgi:hypothetical protein